MHDLHANQAAISCEWQATRPPCHFARRHFMEGRLCTTILRNPTPESSTNTKQGLDMYGE